MATEKHDDGLVSLALPADVVEWLDGQAERRGESRIDICRELLIAAHTLETNESVPDPVDRADLEALRSQLEAQREEFVDHVVDVRERVVEVKREADRKASVDHDHEGYAKRETVATIEADLERLEADLESLEATVTDGFDNFESVVDYLVDETDELTERTASLATDLLDLRETQAELASRDRRRAEADALKLAGNQLGVRTAACADCGSSVDLALLTEPSCPHCEVSLADVERRDSILGSHTLVTGDPPALPDHDERDGSEESTAGSR